VLGQIICGGLIFLVVFYNQQLVLQVLDWLAFDDLMRFRDTCMIFRTDVSALLRQRFITLIGKFFGSWATEVYSLLKATSSIVCGSGSTWIVAYPCVWFPVDLSIVSPKAHCDQFHSIMQRMHWEEQLVFEDYECDRAITSVTAYRSSGLRIDIVDSVDEHTFPGALRSNLSSEMNAVASDGLVVFYPLLTLKSLCVSARGNVGSGRLDIPEGMVHIISELKQGRVCSRSCSKAERRIHGLEGALCVGWSMGGFDSSMLRQRARVCHYTFRLGDYCENELCQYDIKADPWTK
jgi:hypothetical protein